MYNAIKDWSLQKLYHPGGGSALVAESCGAYGRRRSPGIASHRVSVPGRLLLRRQEWAKFGLGRNFAGLLGVRVLPNDGEMCDTSVHTTSGFKIVRRAARERAAAGRVVASARARMGAAQGGERSERPKNKSTIVWGKCQEAL